MFTDKDQELYYVRFVTAGDEQVPMWRPVDKDFFIRHDGPSACGVAGDLPGLIGSQEGVSAAAIYASWGAGGKYYYQVGGDEAALPELLEYTKNHPHTVPYNGDKNAFKTQRRLKMEAVNVYKNRRHKYQWGLVIAKKWVIEEHTLKYDPEYAGQLLADESTRLANVIPTEPSNPRSKISCFRVLCPMVNELRERIDKIYPFGEVYPKRRYHQTIAHVRTPNTLKEYIQAIPAMLQLYWLLARNLDYRTKRWKESIETLLQKHMRDVAMTKDMQRLVTREYAHRQPWEVESEKKGKRPKRASAT